MSFFSFGLLEWLVSMAGAAPLCRPWTADRGPQTVDHRPQTADRRKERA